MKNACFPIKFSIVFIVACLQVFLLSAQKAETVTTYDKIFTNYSTSWIGNEGGYEDVHIPHDMLNMYVRNDGTVATICGWDEGGTNVGVFKDGKLISRPEGSGTGGYGRFSGKAVVMDEQYVYQLLSQNGCDGANKDLNMNGLLQFPPCSPDEEWKTVRRYHYADGTGAPFASGYGYKGDMLVVCRGKRELNGLAIDKEFLYVAVAGEPGSGMSDSIKIYSCKDLSPAGGYSLTGGTGHMYADNKGGIWILQGNAINRIDGKNGKKLPQSVAIPEGAVVSSFAVDTQRNRLLLPNRGKDMNVLIYENIYEKPVQTGTFGLTGGIFSRSGKYMQGEVGPLRFGGPFGVGVDGKGNIYVANTFVAGGRGASLEAYNENNQSLLWKQEGLIFTATADFDDTTPHVFYTPEKIHSVDVIKNRGKRLDKYVAFTVNPFAFPDDERCRENGPFITSCFKRTINGESFLFVSDMYGAMLAGYRFDKPKHGYVAVPFFLASNGNNDNNKPITFWTDCNGDGLKQAEEYANTPEINQYSMSFFVDKQGNIWKGTRGQGFLLWKVKNKNERGIPQYEAVRHFELPKGFSDAKRIWYDSDKDELFLAGFSPVSSDKQDTWWAMGSTIAKCSRFMERVGRGDTNTAQWTPDLLLYIPFGIEDGSGKDYTNAKAFTVAGDYIFIALAREGYISVHNRNSGKFIACLRPGKEVNYQSGWCDFNYAINARKNPDNSYEVLVEENGFGKVLHYYLQNTDAQPFKME